MPLLIKCKNETSVHTFTLVCTVVWHSTQKAN